MLINPFHFFVITRTLSNCLEMVLTITALYFWFSSVPTSVEATVGDATIEQDQFGKGASWAAQLWDPSPELKQLRTSLTLAAIACIMRPTNGLTWLCLLPFVFLSNTKREWIVSSERRRPFWVISRWPLLRQLTGTHLTMIREAVLCG